MYTKKELDFLEWMEDNHASDMEGAVVKELPPELQEIAWKLVGDDVLDCAQSMQTGSEETVVSARGCWLLNQWNRDNKSLPKNSEQVTVHNMGFDELTYFVIQRMPGPLTSLEILELIPDREARPPYRVVPVLSDAKTVVEAMEQLNGHSFEGNHRKQMLQAHPY